MHGEGANDLQPLGECFDKPRCSLRRCGNADAPRTLQQRLRHNAGEFPEARFIFIEHVTPDVIWQDHLLDHPNGVTALREIGFASTDPGATVERLGRLLGVAAAQDGADFCFRLPHTVAKVMSAQAWETRLPGATLLPLPAPVYIGFAVRSLAATRAYLVSASVPLVDAPSAVWVLPQHAAGAALMFCEEE